jgi:hypothetical protein
MRTLTNMAVVAYIVAASQVTQAQPSKEFAVLGQVTWSAFECASWAGVMKDRVEQDRLFNIGLSSGRRFIDAVRAGKVRENDISVQVPVGLVMLLQGPSTDFMLGRIFERVQDHALKEVVSSKDTINEPAVQAVIAGNKFRSSNCQLLSSK